ncbi:hypothetical protein VTN77DRAFT_3050 [Rasamsonia byssochlamydoides]|uniref:uncharacterized protein n=1 Tax=Rasamsonia byssochlamydoides TaxID=89139 RepID=UPI0037433461
MSLPDDVFEDMSLGKLFAEASPDEESFSMKDFVEGNVTLTAGVPRLDEDADVEQPTTELEDELAGYEQDVDAADAVDTIFGVDDIDEIDLTHPWRLIDYNLYLNWIQKGKDEHYRRNCMYLFDGYDCFPFTYGDFFESKTNGGWELGTTGPERKLLFAILPVAEYGPRFDGVHYVLGFDMDCEEFFVRSFNWLPEVSDIWSVWHEGVPLYYFSIWVLYAMMKKSVNNKDGIVDILSLSVTTYCEIEMNNDDPGLEIVIVIQCCQWILDFADIILPQEPWFNAQVFKDKITEYMGQWRSILERASYQAWNAVRDMPPKEVYCRRKWCDQVALDLYSFGESKKVESLRGQNWNAPSQEYCDKVRRESWARYQKETKDYFQQAFTEPDSAACVYSAETLERRKQNCGCMICSVPVTVSSQKPVMPVSNSSSTAGVAPEGEEKDNDIHLSTMLARILNPVKEHSENDTATNTNHGAAQVGTKVLLPAFGEPQEGQVPFRPRRLRLRRDSGFTTV